MNSNLNSLLGHGISYEEIVAHPSLRLPKFEGVALPEGSKKVLYELIYLDIGSPGKPQDDFGDFGDFHTSNDSSIMSGQNKQDFSTSFSSHQAHAQVNKSSIEDEFADFYTGGAPSVNSYIAGAQFANNQSNQSNPYIRAPAAPVQTQQTTSQFTGGDGFEDFKNQHLLLKVRNVSENHYQSLF